MRFRRAGRGNGPAVCIVSILCAAGCADRQAVLPSAHEADPHPLPRVRVVETGPLHIDRIYPSMTGPFDWVEVDVRDLDWVTSFTSEVIDAATGRPMGGEFFCHSQLQQLNETRLFVTATGSSRIALPPGFAMPVSQMLSGLPAGERTLHLGGQVLNNHVTPIDRTARVRATVEFFTHADAGDPPRFKRIYKTGLTLEVEDLDAWEPRDGPPVREGVTTHCALVDDNVVHWVVPPGKQKTRKRYRDFLPVDGTVHQIVVHLHNYAVYMRLTDATTGEILWQTDPVYEPHRVQIAHIPAYSSTEGLRIFKDHEYELEALYDNTSDRDVDAMAMMDLYYHPDGDVPVFYPHGPRRSAL